MQAANLSTGAHGSDCAMIFRASKTGLMSLAPMRRSMGASNPAALTRCFAGAPTISTRISAAVLQ